MKRPFARILLGISAVLLNLAVIQTAGATTYGSGNYGGGTYQSSALSGTLTAGASSGTIPWQPTFSASVGGTDTGTISYTFYCNDPGSGTTVVAGWAAQYLSTSNNPQTTSACTYNVPGVHTATVIIQRGADSAEAQLTMTANGVLSMNLSLPYRTDFTSNDISITPTQTGTSNISMPLTGLSASSSGALQVTDSASLGDLDDSLQYDLDLAAPGYFSVKLAGKSHILSQPITVASSSMVPGNFDGTNVMTFTDVDIAILAYNHSGASRPQLAAATFGGHIVLGNVVTLIRQYNQHVQGN